MCKFSSFEQYEKAEKAVFIRRAKYAVKTRSFKLAAKLVNDIAKKHFARFLVLDSSGTKQFCWTRAGADAWLPFCAAGMARIVDTSDFSTVAERHHAYA